MRSPCRAASEWKVPLGEAAAADRRQCVSVCAYTKACVWPTGHPCTEGPLCSSSIYNTSSLLCSVLRLRRLLSLQPLPILPTDAFVYAHINTHQTAAWFSLQPGITHSFQGGKRVANSAAPGSELWQRQSVMQPQIQTRSPLVWNIRLLCLLLKWEYHPDVKFYNDFSQAMESVLSLSELIYRSSGLHWACYHFHTFISTSAWCKDASLVGILLPKGFTPQMFYVTFLQNDFCVCFCVRGTMRVRAIPKAIGARRRTELIGFKQTFITHILCLFKWHIPFCFEHLETFFPNDILILQPEKNLLLQRNMW